LDRKTSYGRVLAVLAVSALAACAQGSSTSRSATVNLNLLATTSLANDGSQVQIQVTTFDAQGIGRRGRRDAQRRAGSINGAGTTAKMTLDANGFAIASYACNACSVGVAIINAHWSTVSGVSLFPSWPLPRARARGPGREPAPGRVRAPARVRALALALHDPPVVAGPAKIVFGSRRPASSACSARAK